MSCFSCCFWADADLASALSWRIFSFSSSYRYFSFRASCFIISRSFLARPIFWSAVIPFGCCASTVSAFAACFAASELEARLCWMSLSFSRASSEMCCFYSSRSEYTYLVCLTSRSSMDFSRFMFRSTLFLRASSFGVLVFCFSAVSLCCSCRCCFTCCYVVCILFWMLRALFSSSSLQVFLLAIFAS